MGSFQRRGYFPSRPANAASLAGLAAARLALYGSAPAMKPDEALAERERYRVEVDADTRRQGQLLLASKANP